MALTAAQQRYLDKLDPTDVADHLDLMTASDADKLRERLRDTLEAIRRHHHWELVTHDNGPVEWCGVAPCRSIDWTDIHD